MTHPNARRGEIVAELDGVRRRLCLTLGALAELESAFVADDLSALVARFASGRLSARDMARVIGAGLRGGGAAIADEDVLAMTTTGGAAGFATIVAELLAATFGAAQPAAADEGGQGTARREPMGGDSSPNPR